VSLSTKIGLFIVSEITITKAIKHMTKMLPFGGAFNFAKKSGTKEKVTRYTKANAKLDFESA
jgi:hypothetical protein